MTVDRISNGLQRKAELEQSLMRLLKERSQLEESVFAMEKELLC